MAADKEPPKIPTFKPARKGEKKGGGLPLSSLGKPTPAPGAAGATGGMRWPTFGKTAGTPKLRVRGIPGGATLLERLKNLRKKDLMFIGAGLSVLLMAPVAEHFMMTPQQEPGKLTGGFDRKGPLFPDGTSIYESGTGGFSPGGLVGQGTDVITPLNVRDPSALVMGPGASQKPSATVTPPPPKADKPGKSNWKDALAQAAGAGAKKAVRRAKLPKPNVKMTGALRGLAALSGARSGGGPSFKLPALNASNVPNKARGSNSLTRTQADPSYRGAARRGAASGGSPEALKAAGRQQANMFNKGEADKALDSAAAAHIPHGGRGAFGGGPGDGKPGKNPGGNPGQKPPSIGESLELMRAKMEIRKAVDLKWKKKEWREFGRKKMMEEAVYKSAIENLLGKGIFEPIGKGIAKAVGGMFPGGSTTKYYVCHKDPSKGEYETGDVEAVAGDQLKTASGLTITCPGGWSLVGGGSGAAKTPPPGEHVEPPPRVRKPASELPRKKLQFFWNAHCKPSSNEPYSPALCAHVGKIKQVADQTIPRMEEKNTAARAKVDEAYTNMAGAVAGMKKSGAGLGNTLKDVAKIMNGETVTNAGESVQEDVATAIKSLGEETGDGAKTAEAKKKISEGDAGNAKAHMKAAFGEDPADAAKAGCGAGGHLNASCLVVDPINTKAGKADQAIIAAATLVKAGLALAAAGETQLAQTKAAAAADAAVKPVEKAIVPELVAEVTTTLNTVKDTLLTAGGTNGDDEQAMLTGASSNIKTLNGTAKKIKADRVDAAITKTNTALNHFNVAAYPAVKDVVGMTWETPNAAAIAAGGETAITEYKRVAAADGQTLVPLQTGLTSAAGAARTNVSQAAASVEMADKSVKQRKADAQ